MNNRYDEKTLTNLHSLCLDMLKKFIEVCNKYEIDYFIAFGTAIGAARHKGFIPWDDDVDVGMMRDDYEKLKSVPAEEWGEDLVLSDMRDDFDMHRSLFPRLYKIGTAYETEDYTKYYKPNNDKSHPIYIDIFIYDTLDDPKKLKRLIKHTDTYKRILLYSRCNCRIYKKDSFKKQIECLIKKTMHHLLKLYKNSSKKIYNKYIKYVRKHPGEYVTSYELVFTGEKYANLCKLSDMFPLQEIEFEGLTVKIQKNYDEVLRNNYGDYMKLPPENRRFNPKPATLFMGNAYEKDIAN